MISRMLIIKIPTSIGGIKDLKFYDSKNNSIDIDAISDANISFTINNKDIGCTTTATFSDGANLPYKAFREDGWLSVEQEEDVSVEWVIHFDQLIVLGKDISKIEFTREDNVDIKLYSEFNNIRDEVGNFTNASNVYSINTPGKPYFVAKKGNQFYYNKLGTNSLQLDIPKIELLPHWSGVGKATSTTSQTFTYTAKYPGYVIAFAEGGCHSKAGNGRPTATYTEPSDPVFQYDKTDYVGDSGWYYGSHFRIYYMYPGETVKIVANNASGNSYCYCFVGIYRIDLIPKKYKFTVPYKGYSANHTVVSYTHKKNPKDKYLLGIQFMSAYSSSYMKAMTYTTTDNNQLIFDDLNAQVVLSNANVKARLAKLPSDKDYNMTSYQGSTSSTRVPAIYFLLSDMY